MTKMEREEVDHYMLKLNKLNTTFILLKRRKKKKYNNNKFIPSRFRLLTSILGRGANHVISHKKDKVYK
jgi:hypothetical protein